MDRCRVCSHPTRALTIGAVSFDECVRCGFAFLDHQVAATDYWPQAEATAAEFWTDAKRRYFTAALDELGRASPGRRLVDVGGGVGYFAELALADGWDAISVDVSERATAAAAERIGWDRALRSLDELAPASVDVATLWCVVAHVIDPTALLEQVRRVVAPGGLVWITTPNFVFQKRYARFRLWAGRPIDFAADDHLGQFTPSAAGRLLASTGFGPPRWSYCGITEFCATTASRGSVALALKRAWNWSASEAQRLGLPNLMSELQLLSRASP